MIEAELKNMIDELKLTYDSDWDRERKLPAQCKLELLRKIIWVWYTIWNKYAYDKLIIVDCFGGRWVYFNEAKTEMGIGSPLVYLDELCNIQKKAKKSKFIKHVKIYLIEKKKANKQILEQVLCYYKENLLCDGLKDKIEYEVIQWDANVELGNILDRVKGANPRSPLFFFIDPYWIKWNENNMSRILELPNTLDLFFNYMKMWVDRVAWFLDKAKKEHKGIKVDTLFGDIKIADKKTYKWEEKTKETFRKFVWEEYMEGLTEDIDLLESYKRKFIEKNYNAVEFPVIYFNHRNDELYYLLYFCKKDTVSSIIRSFRNNHDNTMIKKKQDKVLERKMEKYQEKHKNEKGLF